MAASEETPRDPEAIVYKTKQIHFLGRSIPIILQNDNGPCPLLAICNVLLLRNNLNLGSETSEVSLRTLLSLIAERLIDSNSNIENKDDEYVHNQQQNISDAMEVLSRLSTGIDVNVCFRNIHDFEFTPECAIFDLLDLGLVHGWICDPQDSETAAAIGSNSYNTLMEKLVSLETRNAVEESKGILLEDSIDFAAATTATLGVPSPCLSRAKSFEDSPLPDSIEQGGRKGDREEVEELMKVLNISRTEVVATVPNPVSPGAHFWNFAGSSDDNINKSSSSDNKCSRSEGPLDSIEGKHNDDVFQESCLLDSLDQVSCSSSTVCYIDGLPSNIISPMESDIIHTKCSLQTSSVESVTEKFGGNNVTSGSLIEERENDNVVLDQNISLLPSKLDSHITEYNHENHENGQKIDQVVLPTFHGDTSKVPISHMPYDNYSEDYNTIVHSPVVANSDISPGDSQSKRELIDVPEDVSSSMSEPIYEGEDCIQDAGNDTYENREPMYEGEMALANQANDGKNGDACGIEQPCEGPYNLTAREGELIRNFLKNNASQLTIYGLFCLQEGLKERELCVFFRNNHFSTMFKFKGELYLLATDQGYINQPDLVWEKLNEVNGDTVFMTGAFTEFKAENEVGARWDEETAMTSTADYRSNIEKAEPSSTLNSDRQLAIALQQQEYEHQNQHKHPQNTKPSSSIGSSRLVTGPEMPKSSSSSTHKHDAKNKDKCAIM
ncbi:hypothetical protein AMTRI_Chr09g15270 [Amborella trichopoda]|uniref:uncharacterized protein LOC18424252 isoform X2 n=1 Tax=Amborella trichopoda TaxID=13333 RepID=UPI0005D4527A|nr:uncharacterized protein LOC18424252 isoform X2 [Amborella trichopoda]|eukprot:XP_011628942.1 uncharacterized protein LOC18424252 isoform X2 [Amborella trichopoda]